MSDHLPLTGSDLREMADAVDEVEATTLAANPLIGRIELHRPEADGDPIAWIDRFDYNDPDMGWGVRFREGNE